MVLNHRTQNTILGAYRKNVEAILLSYIFCLTFGGPSLFTFTFSHDLFYLVFRLKWFIVEHLDALILGGIVGKIKMKT